MSQTSEQTTSLATEPATPAKPATAKLILDGKEYEFPVVVGSEDEVGVDITQLRAKSGAITLDQGYGNTGAARARSLSSTARKESCATAAIPSSSSPGARSSSRSATC